MNKKSAIVFYEKNNDTRGILVHQDTEDLVSTLRERFKGNYKKIVEWIEDGVSGGGYLTPEDFVTFLNPGDTFDELSLPLDALSIASSDVKSIYRINTNGTITEVTPRISVDFVKVEDAS